MTLPLVTKTDGTKFGKTESRTPSGSTPEDLAVRDVPVLAQHADADVVKFLRYFTFLGRDEIADAGRDSRDAGAARGAARARSGGDRARPRRRRRCARRRPSVARCSAATSASLTEPASSSKSAGPCRRRPWPRARSRSSDRRGFPGARGRGGLQARGAELLAGGAIYDQWATRDRSRIEALSDGFCPLRAVLIVRKGKKSYYAGRLGLGQ